MMTVNDFDVQQEHSSGHHSGNTRFLLLPHQIINSSQVPFGTTADFSSVSIPSRRACIRDTCRPALKHPTKTHHNRVAFTLQIQTTITWPTSPASLARACRAFTENLLKQLHGTEAVETSLQSRRGCCRVALRFCSNTMAGARPFPSK